jgi:hypothetical protein
MEEKYNVVNGTAYHNKTSKAIIDVLEWIKQNDIRIKIAYGNVETGEDWEEINDVTGYIGRSTGTYKIPLLIYNKRCIGGSSLLDHCIVKIEYSNKKEGSVLYQNPKYHKKSLAEKGLSLISM